MVNRLFKKMLPAQILSSLAMALCIQVDIILIGQFLGVDGVASYGLVNPILLIFTAITGLLSTGISTVCSQYVGKGEKDNIDGNFSSSMFLSIVISVVFAAIILLAAKPIASFLGAEPGTEIYQMTCDYLVGYGVGIPFYMLMTTMTAYLHLAGKRRLVIISIITMTALDVILDIVNGAIIKDGMRGMGLATSISEFAAFIVILTYFLKKDCMYKLRLKSFKLFFIGRTATAGLPIAVNQVCYTIFSYVMNQVLLTYSGNNGIAAYSVIASLSQVCFTISSGVGTTTQMLSGVFYGEEDRTNLKTSLKNGAVWSVILNVALAIIIIVLAYPIASIYITGDPVVLEMTALAIRIYIPCVIPMGIAVLFKNYYPCIEKLPLAIFISIGENFVFSIGMLMILAPLFGFTGIIAVHICMELLSVIEIICIAWIINKKLSFKISDLSLVSTLSITPDENVRGYSIRNTSDAVIVSRETSEFCRNEGCSKKIANYMALCIEEMACETILNSFKNDGNDLIEVKIVKNPDYWIIRIRDNCKAFDPVNYIELHQMGDDGVSHLGIYMVFKMVTEVSYINSLGFNCLTMRVSAPN